MSWTPSDDHVDRLRRTMRVRPGSKADDRLGAVLDEALDEAAHLIQVRSRWRLLPNAFPGFPAGLQRHPQLIAVAMTAGEGISVRLSELTSNRKFFLANVLDTLTGEALADEQKRIDTEFRSAAHEQGLALTRRYSPGCPHMPMSAVPTIIESLDAEERIGLTCTSAQMLVPVKSLAYVHGADPLLPHDQPVDFCSTCRKTSCLRSRRSHDHP